MSTTGTDVLVREIRIAAPPATVFPYLVDPARITRWLGVAATLDPRPGGIWRVDMNGSDVAAGAFVEVDPPTRVVFTFGWENEGYSVATRREHRDGDPGARGRRDAAPARASWPAGQRCGRPPRRGLGLVPAETGRDRRLIRRSRVRSRSPSERRSARRRGPARGSRPAPRAGRRGTPTPRATATRRRTSGLRARAPGIPTLAVASTDRCPCASRTRGTPRS